MRHRDLDQARRRKWIRTRAPRPLPLDDAFRPLYLAWEVNATPQGRFEVCEGVVTGRGDFRRAEEPDDRSATIFGNIVAF